MKVIVIGAGLGGLACAIACRKEGIDVEVLERAPKILPVGAGIQIPPNGTRMLRYLGVLDRLKGYAIELEGIEVLRYATGEKLHERKLGDVAVKRYGAAWMVIHRADYHEALLAKAREAGANIRLGAEVKDIDFKNTSVIQLDGAVVSGNVIICADGLWSEARSKVLGHPSPPTETGDLAYRGTFTRSELLELGDPLITDLCSKKVVSLWLGPEKHAVFYPVRNGKEFNLVLLRPDNMPCSVRAQQSSLEEMRESFDGWDPTLKKIISCVPSVLKWKLCHHSELKTWTKDNVALLGDACHPTLPYQAQGAAMAVEDGAVIGRLLGLFKPVSSNNAENLPEAPVASVLALYESLRKARTTANVAGAVSNRIMYHLKDGSVQEKRDEALRKADWAQSSEWKWLDPQYNRDLLGFDALWDCEKAFDGLSKLQRNQSHHQDDAKL